jgi:sigma-E factor negative regulatory protein RseA
MSAVASIMAMAFLAWLSVQIDSAPVQQQALLNSNDMRNVSMPANETVNDYLLAHQEYSPTTDMRGAASYIRTVAVRQTAAGE